MIGYRGTDPEHAIVYFFLMKDGSLAFCNLNWQDGNRILAEQLNANCPDIEIIQIRATGINPGIIPEEMIRMKFGENASIRYYTPQ